MQQSYRKNARSYNKVINRKDEQNGWKMITISARKFQNTFQMTILLSVVLSRFKTNFVFLIMAKKFFSFSNKKKMKQQVVKNQNVLTHNLSQKKNEQSLVFFRWKKFNC